MPIFHGSSRYVLPNVTHIDLDMQWKLTLLFIFTRLCRPELFTKDEVKTLHEGIFR